MAKAMDEFIKNNPPEKAIDIVKKKRSDQNLVVESVSKEANLWLKKFLDNAEAYRGKHEKT